MIDVAIEAAKQAGRIIHDRFNSPHTVAYKDENSIVSETDTAAEQAILSILKQEFPDHAFFSEEAGWDDTQSEYRWVIDPLDGTSNFVHHLPVFCVSIALVHQNKPVLAVIYDPIHEDLYTAESGKGTSLNGAPIHPSATQELSKTVAVLGRGSSLEAKDRHGKLYTTVSAHTRTNRIIGSVALSIAYVASGKLDAAIINDSNFYDCAAAIFIASQAGASVTDFTGNTITSATEGVQDILVASHKLTQPLQTIIRGI